MKTRVAIAGAALLVFAGAAGALALNDDGQEVPTVGVNHVANEVPSSTTTAPTATPAPTLAPGFEGYKAGDPLPAAPPAPLPGDTTVSTVQGPHGPIYPDGYVAPEYRDQAPPTTLPRPPETLRGPVPTG